MLLPLKGFFNLKESEEETLKINRLYEAKCSVH